MPKAYLLFVIVAKVLLQKTNVIPTGAIALSWQLSKSSYRTLLSQVADFLTPSVKLSGKFCTEYQGTQIIKVVLHVLMKRIAQANIKRQKHQTSVRNVIFMSAKSVLSLHIVNQKGNRLYDIQLYICNESSYFQFLFGFRVFLLTFDLF